MPVKTGTQQPSCLHEDTPFSQESEMDVESQRNRAPDLLRLRGTYVDLRLHAVWFLVLKKNIVRVVKLNN